MKTVAFDLPPDTLPATLLPRRKVARWQGTGQATAWYLLAGPGSGKTCSAMLLAERLGKPVEWVAVDTGVPHDPGPAHALESLARRHTDGFTLIWDAAERAFDHPAAMSALEQWLKHAPAGCYTVVTSRLPLPFPVSRMVVGGTIERLGPADLWLDAAEVDDWLRERPRHPDVEALLAGWPLGVSGLRQVAGHRDPDALILSLAREEWLDQVPGHWREWLDALLSLPALSLESVAQVLPDADPVAILEHLVDWGLVVGPGPVRPWHPLLPRRFKASKRHLEDPVLEWLGEREPETALAYFRDRDDLPGALRVLRRTGLQVLGERLGPWLTGFSADQRQRSLELAALEAAQLCARGEITEAMARLRDALDRLRAASTGPQVFAALLELLYAHWVRQDFAAFREVEAEAEMLAPQADFASVVRYWNLKAIIRFDSGDDDEAESLTRQILEAPHFGQPAIAYVQQMAALNLGVREVSRGRPETASRHFFRALDLARAYPHRQGVRHGARLYLATCLLDLGRLEAGERHLRELAAESSGEEGKHRTAVFQSLTGHCHLVLGDLRRAEACFDDALNTLATCGLGESHEAASVHNELAVLHRRRGELTQALHRHEQALALSAPWPHLTRNFLLQGAVTHAQAQEAERALAALDRASALAALHPGPDFQAAADLIRAIVARRSGDRFAANDALARSLAAISRGGYFHLAIAYPELVPDLWTMLREVGHDDLRAEFESRFPEALARIGPQGDAAGVLPPAAQDLEIRCFGTLEVFVRGRRIEAWPRKRAKALLAVLLTAPGGLGREELFERLFPEPDDADLETRLNLLTSSLRKLLEPDLAPRQKSRYIAVVDRRFRLETTGVRVDLFEFDEAYKAGTAALEAGRPDAAVEAFRRGIDLYTGDLFREPILMEGFDLERHRCRLRVAWMLQTSAQRAFELGSYEQARALSERLLEIEPAQEGAHRQLMRIYKLFGQEDLLRRQYRLCERLLRQELDLEPSEETRRLALNSR